MTTRATAALATAALMSGLLLTGASAATAAPREPCTANCQSRLSLPGGGQLPYHATYPLTGATEARGAVVVVHGTGRNAQGYFDGMVKAAGTLIERTAIIAPHFQTADDNPPQQDARWTNSGTGSWKDGGNAVRPTGLSSFTAVDHILRTLADKSRFPNLTKVTVAGHSAGGQFVQRYAAGSPAPAELTGLEITYVTANPSSYLYLNSQRPALGSCPGYDNYKYGLKQRNPYMSRPSADQIRARYSSRRVTYLLGERDTLRDSSLDTECPAEAQGRNRFERGNAYFDSVTGQFPGLPHRLVTVPGIGHDGTAMFGSSQGRSAVFNGR
ncbi:alpha/beta fold hydrolase [Crossiella cryophila]|uniref:Pimeloyl-ACP methyl ester carboxylesterase n=1 Tax=Crossiella cryophila TaxID=43355 RepID=A0A7W7CGQ8_9PSEU|nr:alpha/beta fold hydrolase [Crossiella cryophila]MBB4680642.1 pimeloyl-ACP methyl ester carboxylesterase [Crossiella cryophila]